MGHAVCFNLLARKKLMFTKDPVMFLHATKATVFVFWFRSYLISLLAFRLHMYTSYVLTRQCLTTIAAIQVENSNHL